MKAYFGGILLPGGCAGIGLVSGAGCLRRHQHARLCRSEPRQADPAAPRVSVTIRARSGRTFGRRAQALACGRRGPMRIKCPRTHGSFWSFRRSFSPSSPYRGQIVDRQVRDRERPGGRFDGAWDDRARADAFWPERPVLQALDESESALRARPAIIGTFADWEHAPDFPLALAKAINDRGAVPLIAWEPWDWDGDTEQPSVRPSPHRRRRPRRAVRPLGQGRSPGTDGP